MIVFELICTEGHRFEGWFASGEAFERQRAGGLLACPMCSTASIEKLPSARIRRQGQRDAPGELPASHSAPRQLAEAKAPKITLDGVIDHLLRNTEDVGPAFPEEARRIHYEESPRRGIRGTASRDDVEALAEEGIAVLRLPIPPAEDWH